jgi:hypothetical protein
MALTQRRQAQAQNGPAYTELRVPIKLDNYGTATIPYDITAKDSLLGFSGNGESAIAELPDVSWLSNNQPGFSLTVTYNAPGARKYDRSLPPDAGDNIATDSVDWTLGPNAQAMELTGNNHQAQAQDSTNTFIAGILLGVAGSAAVAVAQEGLGMLFGKDDDQRAVKVNRG